MLRNVSTENGVYTFRDQGPLGARILAGHATSPTVVDWDRNGVPDLLVVGAEDGYFYHRRNPR